jgi:hypothetical protein
MNQDEQRRFGGVLPLDDARETLHRVGTGETWPPLAPDPAVIVDYDVPLAPSDSRIRPVACRVTRSFGSLDNESRAWPLAGW